MLAWIDITLRLFICSARDLEATDNAAVSAFVEGCRFGSSWAKTGGDDGVSWSLNCRANLLSGRSVGRSGRSVGALHGDKHKINKHTGVVLNCLIHDPKQHCVTMLALAHAQASMTIYTSSDICHKKDSANY